MKSNQFKLRAEYPELQTPQENQAGGPLSDKGVQESPKPKGDTGAMGRSFEVIQYAAVTALLLIAVRWFVGSRVEPLNGIIGMLVGVAFLAGAWFQWLYLSLHTGRQTSALVGLVLSLQALPLFSGLINLGFAIACSRRPVAAALSVKSRTLYLLGFSAGMLTLWGAMVSLALEANQGGLLLKDYQALAYAPLAVTGFQLATLSAATLSYWLGLLSLKRDYKLTN
jgi:hypothetical protein